MKEVQNLLKIFQETKRALEHDDSIKLKELSNQTIHTASIEQDPDNIAVAVIIYSLSKIIERKKFQQFPGWDRFYGEIEQYVNNSIIYLQKKDDINFANCLKLIRRTIGKLSGKLKVYIEEVLRKASINKASRIYEHGISMEKTASLLGITMFELAGYAGQTGVADVSISKTLDVKSRIKIAMEIFS